MLLTRKSPDDIPILRFFISHFKNTLQSPKSPTYEIRIAIRGFGMMAGPCKQLLPPENIDQLLTLVMQRTENAANNISDVHKETLEHFPDFLESLSLIMNHVDELSGIQISVLQTICISIFRNFHLLSSAHHELTISSLIMTFYNLSRLGDTVLDDVLSKVIYQGVIWTCSHNLVYDARNEWERFQDWKDHLTYTFYLPLWNGILTDIDIANFDRPMIVRKIYEHVLKTLFRLLDKLELSTKKRVFRDQAGDDQELFFCDPNYNLEPIKAKDFHIFFNVVDFYRDILYKQTVESHSENFTKWINQYFETVMTKSFRYPLISGFYKLMKIGLRITNDISYFNEDMEQRGDETFSNVQHFLKNTIATAQQTCGELQVSCLELLFNVPTIMLKTLILDMIPVFIISFDLGRTKTVLFIAQSALYAMERYIDSSYRSSTEVRLFLKQVLPCLDPYLHGFSYETSNSTAVELIKRKGQKRAKKVVTVAENALLKLQKRIILFLGKLEPDQCLYLVASDRSNMNLVKWDVSQNVRLTLHGADIEPSIYLDSMMPHICDIALTSTERQKKMAACEIVHAVILYLIGTDNHNRKLWAELCERMVFLSCDGDRAVQEMFDPLAMQV